MNNEQAESPGDAPAQVFQATTADLQSAYFGEWSAASAWAGKAGHVTTHTLRDLQLVKPAVATSPERLIGKWRSEADDAEISALEADSIGLNEAAKAGDKFAKLSRDHANELEQALTALHAVSGGRRAVAGESDHDYKSDPAEAADNEMSYWDDDGDTA